MQYAKRHRRPSGQDCNRIVFSTICFALLFFKLILAFRLGLGDDEGYYFDWQNHWALGYFDHPPLVGWLVGVGQWILPPRAWAVRLPFILLMGFSAVPFFLVARRLQTSRPFEHVLYVFALIPLYALGEFMAFPDIPMLAAWLWALYFSLKLEDEPHRLGLWTALGIAAGLAIMSKLTAGLLLISLLIWSLTSTMRPAWKSLGPWWAVALIGLIFSPALIWSEQHGFPTVKFQLFQRHVDSQWSLTRGLTFFGLQFALLSPLIFWTLLKTLRQMKSNDRRSLWVLCFSAPALAVFFLQPFKAEFLPHWSAPAYLPLLAFANWFEGGRSIWRKLNDGFLILINVLFIALCLFPVMPWLNEKIHFQNDFQPRNDFSNDFYGWSEAGPWIRENFEQLKAAFHQEPMLLTSRYQLAGNLSFSTGLKATSFGPRANGYNYFANSPFAIPFETLKDLPILYVADNRYTEGPNQFTKLKNCAELGEKETFRFGYRSRAFTLWKCEGFVEPPTPVH